MVRAVFVGVLMALAGKFALAEDAGLDVFDARVAYVTELSQANSRVVEIDCAECPGQRGLALQVSGPDAPRPVSGQPIRLYCRMVDGVMQIVSIDWRPSTF